jgi:probable HAF family extracellular repeat protein
MGKGRMKDLGTLGGDETTARAFNDAGTIVGYSTTPDQQRHAFVWQSDEIFDLNSLVENSDGWVIMDAFKINKNGQIAAIAERNGLKRAVMLNPIQGGDEVTSRTTNEQMDLTPLNEGSRSKQTSSSEEIEETESLLVSDQGLQPVNLSVKTISAGLVPAGYSSVDVFAAASPNFNRVAFNAERDDKKRRLAVIDGEVHPEYLIVNDIIFSPDSSRYAYFANLPDSGRELMCDNGKTGFTKGTCRDLQFTGDSRNLVWISADKPVTGLNGTLEMPASVFRDGKAGRVFGFIGTMRVAGASPAVAFTAVNNGKPIIVVNDEVIGVYDVLPDFPFGPAPVISPDGKRHAFAARRGNGWFIVVDGVEMEERFDDIQHITFSPDSKRVAFTGVSRGLSKVVIDGDIVLRGRERILSRVEFSPNSARFAVPIVAEGKGAYIIDGEQQENYEVLGSINSVATPRTTHTGQKKGQAKAF